MKVLGYKVLELSNQISWCLLRAAPWMKYFKIQEIYEKMLSRWKVSRHLKSVTGMFLIRNEPIFTLVQLLRLKTLIKFIFSLPHSLTSSFLVFLPKPLKILFLFSFLSQTDLTISCETLGSKFHLTIWQQSKLEKRISLSAWFFLEFYVFLKNWLTLVLNTNYHDNLTINKCMFEGEKWLEINDLLMAL